MGPAKSNFISRAEVWGRAGRAGPGGIGPGQEGPGRGAANFCSAHREIFWTRGEKKTPAKGGNYTMEKLIGARLLPTRRPDIRRKVKRLEDKK